MEEEVEVMLAMGQTSPCFRSLFGTTVGIGSQGILMDGTEEQKARYLPKLATGELIASFALTEPDAGSDAASLRTTAIRDGDDYIVNGTKRYITNSPHASLFTLMARTNPADKGAGGVSAFIVDAKSPGITIGKVDKKMGQRGAHTADVIFENCRVPAANIIGGREGQGFKTAMKVLEKGRIHIAAICVGVAERMLRDALRYAMERKQFGQPIAEFQLVQAMLADSQAEVYAARCMVIDAARRRDDGHNVAMEASCAKMFASEMCGRVADRAVQIFGGAGYLSEYGIERFYRDVRLFRLYEGTTQIQQIVIARQMVREAGR
jgi:acyl-CoA dehydrogenase